MAMREQVGAVNLPTLAPRTLTHPTSTPLRPCAQVLPGGAAQLTSLVLRPMRGHIPSLRWDQFGSRLAQLHSLSLTGRLQHFEAADSLSQLTALTRLRLANAHNTAPEVSFALLACPGSLARLELSGVAIQPPDEPELEGVGVLQLPPAALAFLQQWGAPPGAQLPAAAQAPPGAQQAAAVPAQPAAAGQAGAAAAQPAVEPPPPPPAAGSIGASLLPRWQRLEHLRLHNCQFVASVLQGGRMGTNGTTPGGRVGCGLFCVRATPGPQQFWCLDLSHFLWTLPTNNAAPHLPLPRSAAPPTAADHAATVFERPCRHGCGDCAAVPQAAGAPAQQRVPGMPPGATQSLHLQTLLHLPCAAAEQPPASLQISEHLPPAIPRPICAQELVLGRLVGNGMAAAAYQLPAPVPGALAQLTRLR